MLAERRGAEGAVEPAIALTSKAELGPTRLDTAESNAGESRLVIGESARGLMRPAMKPSS
jgi:hypothetical protein